MVKGLATSFMTVVLVCSLFTTLMQTIMNGAYTLNVLAQASNGTNQTRSQSTSEPEINVLERIIVPAQKETVTANQTTMSVSPQVIHLQNKTQIPSK